ncbi:MAG: DUF4920 domain-containing protein [Acidobacteria bacterium]|nr:DUF4920 domain-containing protein [Acidobacteriota bacterium]
MKKSLLFLALIAIFSIGCNQPNNTQPAQTEQKTAKASPPSTETTSNTSSSSETISSEVIKRGAALSGSTVVQVTQVMESPKSYEGKTLTVEGQIARVCQAKGCWMELTEKEGDPGMRITFKDYGFFVPTDSQGKKVKAEGKVELKVLPKDEVEHYVSEGAKLKVNSDGTSNTVSLVASGVEVY